MSHVEYDIWLSYIQKILKKYNSNHSSRILEIGGGTGILGKTLKDAGYNYYGSDLSFQMASEANKKGCSFFCADCKALPLKSTFDLVIFLYDGINYLLSLEEYKRLFNQISSVLSKDGLFLFDITTQTNSIRYFTDYFDHCDYDDYSYIRHSFYNPENNFQINDFTIFKKVKSKSQIFQRFSEHHVQKVFPAKSIEQVIPRDLFNIIGIWDEYSYKKYSSRSERIHFLLQRTN
jgi:ubiquinone/menaquinone biosynthesis C-methylase UbiE